MAVDSTPERSLSDLLSSSRAALAMTGCGPARRDAASSSSRQASTRSGASDRTGRRRRRPASCPSRHRGRAGSRRPAANGWSFPNGCACRASLRDRPGCRRCSGRRGLPIRRGGPRAADCRPTISRWSDRTAARGRAGAKAGGQLPVLALDVVDDGRARPGQQRGHDQADALAGSGRREAQHMLRPVMAQIVAVVAAEHHAIGTEQPGRLHLLRLGPARRAVGLDVLGFARPPDRHADGDGDGDEAARRRDEGALDEDRRRIGVVEIPPPEEGGRIVDGQPNSSNQGVPSCG
jgi:hypothetical protein